MLNGENPSDLFNQLIEAQSIMIDGNQVIFLNYKLPFYELKANKFKLSSIEEFKVHYDSGRNEVVFINDLKEIRLQFILNPTHNREE